MLQCHYSSCLYFSVDVKYKYVLRYTGMCACMFVVACNCIFTARFNHAVEVMQHMVSTSGGVPLPPPDMSSTPDASGRMSGDPHVRVGIFIC